MVVEKTADTAVTRIKENVVQEAIDQTEFGWFNIKIYIVSALIYMNIGIGFGNIGLIIPSAANDLQMTTIEKGRIALSPLIGMLFSPYFWAIIAEVYGRRSGLMMSLCIHFISEILAAVISSYWGLFICKLINGFSLGAQLSLLFTYLGEFQPSHYRDKLFSWIEMPYCFGLIIIAGLGWLIIPQDIEYKSSIITFFFKSWNLYLIVCGFPAFILCILIARLPDTPKYLAESGQINILIDVLYQIFHENTKLSSNDYLNRLRQLQNPAINELLILHQETSKNNSRQTPSLHKKLKNFFHQTKEILKPPYLKTTFVVCLTIYGITYAYLTMMFWLPEIFRRFTQFHEIFPGESASICTVSDILYSSNAVNSTQENHSSELNTTVYIHNMILGIACVPVSLWFPLFVEKIGYKIHFLATTIISNILVICVLFVNNSVQNLILFAIFEAMTSLSITIIFCILVELYPTHLRVIAAAFATFVSRIGAVIGIAAVGYLIDDYCKILIFLISFHLVLASILGCFVPMYTNKEKNKMALQTKNSTHL